MNVAAHKEKAFENDIVQGFQAQGWAVSENDDGYDADMALYVPDVIEWLKGAYKDKFERFAANHSGTSTERILDHLVSTLRNKGPLWLLRNDTTLIGFGAFRMSESKPEDQRNKDVQARYRKNILRVMQQVHFRTDNRRESIDLVFFINGIPVATAEVKTNFTQDVNEAVEEYKKNRKPKPRAGAAESPLLKAERGAVVHFAISETDIQMTTKLDGEKTRFLPFNKGCNGHAGNPKATKANPYLVSFFWKELGKKDAWLGLFHNFAFREESQFTDQFGIVKTKSSLIFPRYHQWRAVTHMVADAKKYGAGQKYLIEHSAGSGKTKTITWTAFQLSMLRDAKGNAHFDTILVMSDRKVLDNQLSKAVRQFNTIQGLVQPITDKRGSKTAALVEALEDGKRIVVVTIQTFPFAMEQIILNDKLKGKHFAVIFDEAHNSQAGRSSARLNAALGNSGKGIPESETIEELLTRLQESRRRPDNVSFFGFTATPKHQTFMLFGRKKNGEAIDLVRDQITEDSPDSEKPVSFDQYPMRQAIEEGFILDVMQGYLPYQTAYKLSSRSEADKNTNKRVDGDAVRRGLAQWKSLHPTNVTQKVKFIIDHFRNNVASMLNGQAKAMIVTSSRAAVVRYQKAFIDYISKHPEQEIPILRLGVPLAAFSGEVAPESAVHDEDKFVSDENMVWVNLLKSDTPYTEQNLNSNVDFGQDGALERAFDTDDYRIMIVANKFQTGFDQPKLCAMYIDKIIGNEVEIVQTYSRVNRIFPGKDRTFIVDFVNDKDNVVKAFRRYDQGAAINEGQDPQVLEKLRISILDAGIFDADSVETFTGTYYAPQLMKIGIPDPDAHKKLELVFSDPANKYMEQLRLAYERCKDLELEHENALTCEDVERAAAADNRLKEASKEYQALRQFKTNLGRFVSAYNYIAQITSIEEGSLEGFVTYCALLNKRLLGITPTKADLTSVMLTHYDIKALQKPEPKTTEEAEPLRPISGNGAREPNGKLPEFLRDILDQVSNFAGDTASVEDALAYCYTVSDKVSQNEVAKYQVLNNNRETAKMGAMTNAVTQAVFDLLAQNKVFAAMVAKNPAKKDELLNIVYSLIRSPRVTNAQVKEYEESPE